MKKDMVIGLTYDLRDDYLKQGFSVYDVGEFDSINTIDSLDETIRDLGYKTERIGNVKSLCNNLVAGKKWDLVFNIAEGLNYRSREAQVPAILEAYGIPYTGSDPLTCAMTLDKVVAKKIIRYSGIPTPYFWVISKEEDLREHLEILFPVFAKPIAEGTGKGIDDRSKINSIEELYEVCPRLIKRFSQPVLVEKYLSGREFTVGILGAGKNAWVIGTIEIKIHADSPIQTYSFEAKENCENLIDYFPIKRNQLTNQIEKIALNSYIALDCRDVGRVDIKLDEKCAPYFLEINPLPGLHPLHSDLPIIATQNKMSYQTLIESIIISASSRIKK